MLIYFVYKYIYIYVFFLYFLLSFFGLCGAKSYFLQAAVPFGKESPDEDIWEKLETNN